MSVKIGFTASPHDQRDLHLSIPLLNWGYKYKTEIEIIFLYWLVDFNKNNCEIYNKR